MSSSVIRSEKMRKSPKDNKVEALVEMEETYEFLCLMCHGFMDLMMLKFRE